MRMFSVRLSRMTRRQPISMRSTRTTVSVGRNFQAKKKPSDIIRTSLVELRMLSPA